MWLKDDERMMYRKIFRPFLWFVMIILAIVNVADVVDILRTERAFTPGVFGSIVMILWFYFILIWTTKIDKEAPKSNDTDESKI